MFKIFKKEKVRILCFLKTFKSEVNKITDRTLRRLESNGKLEGLMVGQWGGCSKDLHSLVKVLGENKVVLKARATGREASENELGIIISLIRKYLLTAFIREQNLCLIL